MRQARVGRERKGKRERGEVVGGGVSRDWEKSRLQVESGMGAWGWKGARVGSGCVQAPRLGGLVGANR